MTSPSATHPSAHDGRRLHDDGHITPSDIAIGVIIGRASEFFDFFVYAIASVIIFPQLIFSFTDPLTGTIWSFAIFALAFIARPFGTAIFSGVARAYGKGTKLSLALLLLGTSTVLMGFLPSYETAGVYAIVILALLRIGQGLALGGAWDGLASLLAKSVPAERRGFWAMVPQLGAPIGLFIAAGIFVFLLTTLSAEEFMGFGWRFPFFVAFAINVVALFARLRIVVTPEYTELFKSSELAPQKIGTTLAEEGQTILTGAFVPLASFALLHMVTVFPLGWVFLFTEESPARFLTIEAIGAVFGLFAVYFSGGLSDMLGRRTLLFWGAIAIAIFSLIAPFLLSAGQTGELVYIVVGFTLCGLSFGQSSGAVASLFKPGYRYTASALTSDLAWLFGAGFAPIAALLLSVWLDQRASGLYLLSGAICTILALRVVKALEFRS